MVTRVRCEIVVEVPDEKWKDKYDSLEDYLNDCVFSVVDSENEDICTEVSEYYGFYSMK